MILSVPEATGTVTFAASQNGVSSDPEVAFVLVDFDARMILVSLLLYLFYIIFILYLYCIYIIFILYLYYIYILFILYLYSILFYCFRKRFDLESLNIKSSESNRYRDTPLATRRGTETAGAGARRTSRMSITSRTSRDQPSHPRQDEQY